MPTSRKSKALPGHPKAWIAIGLAFAAGAIDVIGWLLLYHIYTAHMTGNTSSTGIDLARGNLWEAFRHAWPIIPFVGGLLYSALTTATARRRGFRSSFAVALTTEVLLLMIFLVVGSRVLTNGGVHVGREWEYYGLLSLPAAALGMQTVTVTRINGLRVYTTYLTGSLSKFAEAVAEYSFWLHDQRRGRSVWHLLSESPHQQTVQHAALTAGLVLGYLLGAFTGAVTEQEFALRSLLFPIAVLLVAIIVDLVRPVAAADDPEGSAS